MPNNINLSYEPEEAYVVFSGKTDMKWVKLLKPGFRHCFILFKDNKNWISIDPISPHTEIQIHHVPVNFDLPKWLKSRGQIVMPAELNRKNKKAAPLMPFTCVEAVKRLLGIHSRWIFTPWQLYRHLDRII